MENQNNSLTDTLGRSLQDLRISVTDRCNFRCTYCMPKELFGWDHPFLQQDALLSFAEIERLARIFAAYGVRKIRLTGGEPLLRNKLEQLIESLASIPGIEDIALTSNGSLITPAKAKALRDAGLNRITISLDSLDETTFQAINDVGFPVANVLEGIDNAANAGLAPVKVNMVVKRGVNDGSILPMARQFRGTEQIPRFIEYMDVGSSNGWRMDDVVSAAQIRDTIQSEFPIEPVDPNYPGEVANRWQYQDQAGEIGIISSVTQPFCGSCTRARLSAEGFLYTCLFASGGHNLRQFLRDGFSDQVIHQAIASIWSQRDDRYSELRTLESADGKPNRATTNQAKVEMSYIGG